jgi:aminopeptidase C
MTNEKTKTVQEELRRENKPKDIYEFIEMQKGQPENIFEFIHQQKQAEKNRNGENKNESTKIN